LITHTDILIVGAGPGGAAAALFLAKNGIASTVVDKATFPRDKICGDALSGKVVEVMNKLDKQMVSEIASDSNFLGSHGVIFVAPNAMSLRVPFRKSGNTKTSAPGFISKRMDFDNYLVEKLRSNQLVRLRENCELRDFEKTETGYKAFVKNSDEVFEAKLVIAADGAYSTFAKKFGGIDTEPEHNCFGLRAYYKNVSGMDNENFIELHFMPEILPGYFWIFPLPGGFANIGVGMRADKMQHKKINLKKQFELILEKNESIRQRFSKAEQVGEVKLWGLPLGSKKRKLSGDNFMLLGDAAQLIDPFTGEGIGNAMMSGMFAALQAADCIAHNDFSSHRMIEYDTKVYHRLWSELQLSYRMQQMVNFPWLFNLVVRKANRSKLLSETISCMFEDLDMRAKLRNPLFYLRLLFS
jgi:geranylgeranyl reductase family protein